MIMGCDTEETKGLKPLKNIKHPLTMDELRKKYPIYAHPILFEEDWWKGKIIKCTETYPPPTIHPKFFESIKKE